MKKYVVKIDIEDRAIFDSTNSKKEIEDQIKQFYEAGVPASLSIWRRDGKDYQCICNENTRKIGF